MARVPATGSAPTGPDPLGPNQEAFAKQLATRTGLDLNVVRAWVHSEQPYDSPATGVMPYNDWLNIGWTDSGRTAITYASDWNSPNQAADRTAEWLSGSWGSQYSYSSAPSIRNILKSAGESPADQIRAIQESGWASGGYPSLPGAYAAVSGAVPAPGGSGSAVQTAQTRGSGGGGGGLLGALEGAAGSVAHDAESITSSLWGDVTSSLDFFKAVLWLVNPVTWLRAVEFIAGFTLSVTAVFVMVGAADKLPGLIGTAAEAAAVE